MVRFLVSIPDRDWCAGRMYIRHGVAFLLLGALATLPVLAQTTVTLTGGDPGEGLTLNASNVIYAYNVNGSSSFGVQGVTFAPLNLGSSDPTFKTITTDPFASGQDSIDDAALRSILQTVAWDGFGAPGMSHTFTGLTANATYRFDLLYYAGSFASREQAIIVNGSLIGLVTALQSEAQNTYFSVAADSFGAISLTLRQSGGYGGTGHQDGALLNAVAISAVPEPSTYAAILGTFAFGFVLWRRRKNSRSGGARLCIRAGITGTRHSWRDRRRKTNPAARGRPKGSGFRFFSEALEQRGSGGPMAAKVVNPQFMVCHSDCRRRSLTEKLKA